MELGARIRQARLESGLSQRQVCGDFMTRNMLSLIENGAAHPSVETLTYLARRLGKSASYFLDEDGFSSPNGALMAQLRGAFAKKEYAGVLKALEEYIAPDAAFDEEAALLRESACLSLAEQAVKEQRLPYAKHLLEQVRCEGLYIEGLRQRKWLLESRCGDVSEPHFLDPYLIVRARQLLEQGNATGAAALLDVVTERDVQWLLLRADCYLALEEYAAAVPLLQQAENAGEAEAVAKLERCYTALEDYKMAYLYACKQKK